MEEEGGPPSPWIHVVGTCCLVRGPPPPSPPWWPHGLSARCRSGGLRSSSASSGMPRARSAHFPFQSPVSVSLASWPPVPMVASWPSPRSWFSAVAGSPVSRTCSRARAWRRRYRQYAFKVSPRCLCLPPCPDVGSSVPPSPARSSSPRYQRCPCLPRFLGWWGGSAPSPPLSVLPRNSVSLGSPSGGFVPPGQLFHSGGVDAHWRLDSPSHFLAISPGVFRHSGGLATPLTAPPS